VIFLFLWTLVVSAGMLFLYVRNRAMQAQLDEERRSHDLVARQHRDVVSVLRTTETRDSMVLDNIDEIIFRLKLAGDTPIIDSMSSRVTEILGYTPEEVIALGAQLIHPEDMRTFLEKTREAFQTSVTTTLHFRARHRDGHYRWFENRLRGVGPSGTEGPTIFGVARDITAQMETDQERRRSDEDVQQAHKMEALGRLAGGIAHDFNNLLTTIGGNASFLLEVIPDDDPARESLDDILAACDRAARFTRQLLAFSRKQVLQPQALDLAAVIGEMKQMLARLLGPEFRLEVDVAPGLPRISSDRGQMEQVVLNLVVNARDAMPGGGPISVHARLATGDDEEAMARMPSHPATAVVIEVADKGVGIPDDIRERIFEPFFTTKDVGKGTGLGLAMVYGFVRQSGGHIDLVSDRVSEKGSGGTAFRIYLPAVASVESAATATAAAEKPTDDHRPLTVLVADDEPGVRHLASAMLRRSGYSVLEAADGKDAERVAIEHDGDIHVLLTDIVMPGFRGPELAQRLRKSRPLMRVVYMSGFRDTEPLADVEQGEAVFLAKPFVRAALLGAVSRMAASA
jgi:two-component system cell cycle sensor histidine kinase/response regulator CckA